MPQFVLPLTWKRVSDCNYCRVLNFFLPSPSSFPPLRLNSLLSNFCLKFATSLEQNPLNFFCRQKGFILQQCTQDATLGTQKNVENLVSSENQILQKSSVFNENHRQAPGADGNYGPWALNVPRNSFSDETGATSSAPRDVLHLRRGAFWTALENFNAKSEIAAAEVLNLGALQGSFLIWVPCWGL